MTDILDRFVESFKSGAQGCEMDYSTAQELALAIQNLQDELVLMTAQRDGLSSLLLSVQKDCIKAVKKNKRK